MDAVTLEALRAWLAASPQVVRTHGPVPSIHDDYVRLRGTQVEGYVSPSTATRGTLASGQRVMIMPVDSAGSGGVFAALLYTVVGGTTRFVGYVPSASGHLRIGVVRGRIEVRTPVYGPDEANCCPSRIHVEHDTLRGIRLVRLDAHDERRR